MRRSAAFVVLILVFRCVCVLSTEKPSEDLEDWLIMDAERQSIDFSLSVHVGHTLGDLWLGLTCCVCVSSFLPAADIYCVGFQEIVDLNAGNLLVDHNAAKPWEDKIEHTLKQQFKQVASKHLVGLSLCVYVKRALFLEVSDISAESVGVGIMGVGVRAHNTPDECDLLASSRR